MCSPTTTKTAWPTRLWARTTLFYQATQDDDGGDSLEQSDAWRVDPAHARCVVDHISNDHAELAAYACRTLGDVLAQASAKRAAPFATARGHPRRRYRAASRMTRRRSRGPALGALAQLLRALRRFGLAAPAAVRQARAGLGGAPAVAAACADAPAARSDDARWQLAHLNVANSVLASDGGLACAEAPGLAPALARALAGGRPLGARAGQVRRGATAHLPARAGRRRGVGARARRRPRRGPRARRLASRARTARRLALGKVRARAGRGRRGGRGPEHRGVDAPRTRCPSRRAPRPAASGERGRRLERNAS